MLQSSEEKIVKDGVGVIVGRFQPMTDGHRDIIQSVISRHEKTIIVVGVSEVKCTPDNTLDFEIRRRVIQKAFPGVQIVYQHDHPSDKAWSKILDKLIRSNVPPLSSKTILYGSRDNFSARYSGSFKVVELLQERYTSATEVRKKASYKISDHEQFIDGALWCAQNQYPTAYCAVDTIIIDKKYNRMLLGRKENQTKFRFIGGFVEPDTDAYEGDFLEMNARREVKEETGLEVGNLNYVGSYLIKDWRYSRERHKIFSALFTADYVFGAAKPEDDIHELAWFDLDKIKEKDVVDEHKPLLSAFLKTLEGGE
jgi:bifunctional NMN adenylyltransferase/nudix hydrolase